MGGGKCQLREVTPAPMDCLINMCPRIYEGVRSVAPKEMDCVLSACPGVYEAKGTAGNGGDVYLIIGKQINPTDAGLEKKVGEGEVLIEVPRALIDDRRV